MNKMKEEKMGKARIGVFSVGYDKYWSQFPGLLDELLKKEAEFIRKIPVEEVEVFSFGMVDSPAVAYEKVKEIVAANLDFLFCDMLTYATSGTFGVIARSVQCPIVLVALQPLKAMNYKQATTYMQLVNDDICALPEFTGVAVRLGKPVPEIIIGTLYDDRQVDEEVREYCRIAKVLHSLKNAKLGHIGHPLNSMMDMNTDPTMLTAFFGSHVISYEPNELNGLAYYYDGADNSSIRQLMSNLIVGNSLLTARHIPMCGESDLKTLVALMIMDRLGIGGSFAEFHPIDFNDGFVLVGHDGPHNISIAEGKPVLRSLKKYHGKPGNGAGVEFKIKEGPITLLSINSTYDGKFKLIIAEGESVSGPIPPTGNTNTRGFFQPDVRTFLKRWISEGPTHHFALGIGHHAATLEKIARYLNLEYKIISVN